MDLLDPGVADGAGLGDVLDGDGGFGGGVGQDAVVVVAVVAGRGDDQALLEQGLAVDALGVVAEDVLLGDVVDARDRRPFPVARPQRKGMFIL